MYILFANLKFLDLGLVEHGKYIGSISVSPLSLLLGFHGRHLESLSRICNEDHLSFD